MYVHSRGHPSLSDGGALSLSRCTQALEQVWPLIVFFVRSVFCNSFGDCFEDLGRNCSQELQAHQPLAWELAYLSQEELKTLCQNLDCGDMDFRCGGFRSCCRSHVEDTKESTFHVVKKPQLSFQSISRVTYFVDLENKDALQTIAFINGRGHRWSRVASGLNIEGKCTHMSCPANGKRVIYPMGYCEFSITTGESRCPLCSNAVEAITCGFTTCKWKYRGRKQGSDAEITSDWQIVGDEYERFREPGNMAGWEVLIINAKPNPLPRPQCLICLHDMQFVEEHQSLECGCRFHSDCVASWKLREAQCPTCRVEINMCRPQVGREGRLQTRNRFRSLFCVG